MPVLIDANPARIRCKLQSEGFSVCNRKQGETTVMTKEREQPVSLKCWIAKLCSRAHIKSSQVYQTMNKNLEDLKMFSANFSYLNAEKSAPHSSFLIHGILSSVLYLAKQQCVVHKRSWPHVR